jgi:hypothetical protein
MPTCGKRALRKATGSNRFRQLCFRRIVNHMGMRVKLGEKLWGAFMKDMNVTAKALWHPAFVSGTIRCAGVLDGPPCPIQDAGIILRLDEIDADLRPHVSSCIYHGSKSGLDSSCFPTG